MMPVVKSESMKINDQFALWFPDAVVPTLRTLPASTAFTLSVGQKDMSWYVFLNLANAPQEAIAEYQDEKSARRALRHVVQVIAGNPPKNKWWYARWSGVFFVLFFVVLAEITFSISRFQETNSGVSVPTGGRPPGAIPMSSFTPPSASPGAAAITALPQPTPPASPFAGAIPAAPVDRMPKAKSTGLSAFGLDERTPPGGLKDIPSNSKIDAMSEQSGKTESGGDQKAPGAP